MFSSYWFVAFAGILFFLYWTIQSASFRKALLAFGCALFYWHFAGPSGVLPIVILAVVTYCAGISNLRGLLILAIVANVAALIFYKYTLFISGQLIGAVLPSFGEEAQSFAKTFLLQAVPPLGISFFVFEFVHYLVDVLKGKAPLHSPLEFGLFGFFFPTIVAGPIKRYEQFIPSFKDGVAKLDPRDIVAGFCRVLIGLGKKLVLADFLSGYISHLQPQFGHIAITHRWMVFVAIGLRIFFDFSGYSDIAIGLALMLGIKVPENFNWPYLATSVQDFWHRWHISLSTWIRDYVYIPLGGSRHGLVRKAINALVAFALCGLWHGAAWNFMFWGIYHGIGLVISTNFSHTLGRPGRAIARALDFAFPVKWALTQFFVFFGWLLFFYPVKQAGEMLLMLFGWSGPR